MYYILLVSNFHESGWLLLLLLRSRSFPQVACKLCQHTMKTKTPRDELKIEECTDVQSVIRTTKDGVTTDKNLNPSLFSGVADFKPGLHHEVKQNPKQTQYLERSKTTRQDHGSQVCYRIDEKQ